MSVIVFPLCALVSLLVAVMLLRAHRRRRLPLLFWSGWCFVGFTLSNFLLLIDAFVVPDTSLAVLRSLPTLLGLVGLLYGMVWET